MSKTQEALKMAIEALELINEHAFRCGIAQDAIKMCKEALVELKCDAVGEVWWHEGQCNVSIYPTSSMPKEGAKLYTLPPKREWRGLEFMELSKIFFEFVMLKDENGNYKERFGYAGVFIEEIEEFAKAIESKLKELNHE